MYVDFVDFEEFCFGFEVVVEYFEECVFVEVVRFGEVDVFFGSDVD